MTSQISGISESNAISFSLNGLLERKETSFLSRSSNWILAVEDYLPYIEDFQILVVVR